VTAVQSPEELAPNLRAGTLSVGEKPGEFSFRSSIESFGNIVHRRTGCTVELVGQREVFAKGSVLQEVPNPLVQLPSHLPCFNFFKCGPRHGIGMFGALFLVLCVLCVVPGSQSKLKAQSTMHNTQDTTHKKQRTRHKGQRTAPSASYIPNRAITCGSATR